MGKTILIIEDDENLAETLNDHFELLGAKSFVANTFKSAYPIIKKENLDHIVCDFHLKKVTAFQILAKLMEDEKKIPNFLIMTGKVDLNEDEVIKSGANGLIKKPFAFDDLVNVLEGESLLGSSYSIADANVFKHDIFEFSLENAQVVEVVNLEETAVYLSIESDFDAKSCHDIILTREHDGVKKKISLQGEVCEKEEDVFGNYIFKFAFHDCVSSEWSEILKERENKQEQIADFLRKAQGH